MAGRYLHCQRMPTVSGTQLIRPLWRIVRSTDGDAVSKPCDGRQVSAAFQMEGVVQIGGVATQNDSWVLCKGWRRQDAGTDGQLAGSHIPFVRICFKAENGGLIANFRGNDHHAAVCGTKCDVCAVLRCNAPIWGTAVQNQGVTARL